MAYRSSGRVSQPNRAERNSCWPVRAKRNLDCTLWILGVVNRYPCPAVRRLDPSAIGTLRTRYLLPSPALRDAHAVPFRPDGGDGACPAAQVKPAEAHSLVAGRRVRMGRVSGGRRRGGAVATGRSAGGGRRDARMGEARRGSSGPGVRQAQGFGGAPAHLVALRDRC